ncbi:MAG: TPM domain-containing protein [Clostridia bacterium]|nr:TPM domain-containing protein [Clostridia bacterium]
MTKKLFAILVAFVICLSMVISASAYTDTYVYDPDNHLTSSEISEINNYASYIESYTGVTIMFSITGQEDMSNDEFAYMAYDTNTDNDMGICVVHNTTDEMYYWYVTDSAQNLFPDAVVKDMLASYDNCESYFDGVYAYFETAESYVEGVNAPVADNSPTEAVTEKNENKPEEDTTKFVPVDRTLPLVVDNADIIPDGVESALLERCDMFASEYEMEVAIVTVNDFEGKTSEAYADDFYDYNGYGWGENDDGVLVVYKPGEEGEREIWITTHGRGSEVFFEGIREGMITDMIPFLTTEDYEGAFTTYLDRAETQLKPGIAVIWLFILMLAGAVIGLIITGSMTAKNKTVVLQKNAKVYTRQGSMNVTGRNDVFLYTRTDVQPKAQDNDSDNDSSTHTSSSGRTHNGSGAKF